MKALSLTIQKLWPMSKFLWTNKGTDGRQDKKTGQKLYAPDVSMQGHKNSQNDNANSRLVL